MNACHGCLRRMWLLERLAPNLELKRAMIERLLGLEDLELITLLGGAEEPTLIQAYASFFHADAAALCDRAAAAGLGLVCHHAEGYPERLGDLAESAPRVLAVNGGSARLAELCAADAVAIVGTRKASTYGLAAARGMGRELAMAGLTVVSGMAFGIDSAAHEGALQAGGRTIAVLAGSADRAYPARKTVLFERILDGGCVISELGAGVSTWRWALQARNRTIAGLAAATVLVEAPTRSGAMITVGHADRLERAIGVLPGPVGVSQSAGPNLLLAKGRAGRNLIGVRRVRAVRHAQDVLDLIYGQGIVAVPEQLKPAPTASEAALLEQLATQVANVTMLEPTVLGDLAALELKGWVARGPGGSITVLGE